MSDNSIIDLSQLPATLGDYRVGKSQALRDSSLLPLVRNYKRTVASRMYPLSGKDIPEKISDSEYLVSRKIDGEFNVLIYKNGVLLTVNPGGTVRTGLPWMTEAKQLLDDAAFSNVTQKTFRPRSSRLQLQRANRFTLGPVDPSQHQKGLEAS